MLKRSLGLLALCFIVMTLGAVQLHADQFTFTLNFTNGFIATCPSGGCATVNIVATGTQATITVSSLLSGYQFDSFGFNLSSGTITSFSSSGTVNTANPNYGLGAPPAGPWALNGFGKFQYVFDTGINGGSTGGNCVVTSGSPSAGCTFVLTLNGTGLTSYQLFEVLSSGGAGDGNAWFAGHVAGSTCTGFVGGGNPSGNTNGSSGCGPVQTPEPNTLSLLGFVRRRALWVRRRVLSIA
jgi:hypothetical protein